MTQTAAAPTAAQMTVRCPACGAMPGRACTSLVAPPEVDQNLALKPSHYARRHAYFLAQAPELAP